MLASRLLRGLKTAALIAGVAYLSGCYTMRSMPIYQAPLPDSLYVNVEGSEEPIWIHYPRFEGDEVVGWHLMRRDSTLVRVPATQEQKVVDGGKTAIVAAAVAVGAFLVGLLVAEALVTDGSSTSTSTGGG